MPISQLILCVQILGDGKAHGRYFHVFASREMVDHLLRRVLVIGDGEPLEAYVPPEGRFLHVPNINLHLRKLVAPMMIICMLIAVM